MTQFNSMYSAGPVGNEQVRFTYRNPGRGGLPVGSGVNGRGLGGSYSSFAPDRGGSGGQRLSGSRSGAEWEDLGGLGTIDPQYLGPDGVYRPPQVQPPNIGMAQMPSEPAQPGIGTRLMRNLPGVRADQGDGGYSNTWNPFAAVTDLMLGPGGRTIARMLPGDVYNDMTSGVGPSYGGYR